MFYPWYNCSINISGRDDNDSIFGYEGDNAVYVVDGNNTPEGKLGDDTLEGERGDDLLIGGYLDNYIVEDNDIEVTPPPPTQLLNQNYDIFSVDGFPDKFYSTKCTYLF